MNAPTAISKAEQIRLRDGDRCWLCAGKLDFTAQPNSSKSPTIEHLLAKANGGTNALDNLVLAHPGCNKQLGTRSVAEKQRMRAKYRAARERTHAARQVCASTPVEEGGSKPIERLREKQKARPAQEPWQVLRFWQALAVVAVASAMLATGFAAGLLVAG